jgi:hypothetical protein
LDIDCGILCIYCWPNFQVEKPVSTMKIQEDILLNTMNPQAGLGRDQKGGLAC